MSYVGAGLRQLYESYKYAYPSARAKALKSLLLTSKEIEEVIESPDLGSAIQLLRESVYGAELKDLPFEEALNRNLSSALLKVRDFLPRPSRDIFTAYLGRFETGNINAILIAIQSKIPIKKRLAHIIPIAIHLTSSDIESTASSKGLEEALASLSHTPYHPCLERGYEEYLKTRLFTAFEMELDSYLYSDIADNLKKNRGIDVAALERLIGVEIDIKNIKSLLRLKDANVPPERIYPYLLPNGFMLKGSFLRSLSREDSLEEVISKLERTHYHEPLEKAHKEFEKVMKGRRLAMLEKALDEYQKKEYRRFAREFPLSIGPVIGYVNSKYEEVRILRTILKLKEADFPKKDIYNLLEWEYGFGQVD